MKGVAVLERKIRQGLRVLVTAGAAGIGRVIARTLVEDGARVHVCDVDEAALADVQRALPVTASVADVAEDADVERMFGDVRRSLGGLDVLVNNAGVTGPTAAIEDITPEAWRRTIAVNLNGQFYCAHFAIPLLRDSPDGAIVNIASVAGRLGYAYRTPYAASKWAIVGLTESLARELGPRGIRVNAVLPGIVEGPRMEGVIRSRAAQFGVDYAEMERQYLQKISLRRMVSPEDVAAVVLFLCAPAGRHISGQALSVCGNVETL